MPKRTYEVLLVIEAGTIAAAREAANAAWYAADDTERCSVVDSFARERLPNGKVAGTSWPDWQDESTLELRVRHSAEDDPEV
jgi:hypothetical protein